MSDGLTFNKFAGAGLATALVIAGLAVVPPIFFEKEPPKNPGYKVDISAVEGAAGGGEAAADVPPDWGTVLHAADIAAGQGVSDKCKSCHSFEASGAPGPSAPSLYGVLGRAPGTSPAFAAQYSPAMKAYGATIGKWDFQHVYDFVHKPQQVVEGTKMTFVGVGPGPDRINLIAYLNTLGSNLPVPPPAPKAAAAPAAGAAPASGAAPAAGAAPAGKGAAPAAAPAAATAPAAGAAPAGGTPAKK